MSGAHQRYVTVKNATASKERLMVNLFETALRQMRAAIGHFENKEPRKARVLLDKASQIVAYLHGTLNREVAPALTSTLAELYVFTIARLSRAILTGKISDVREAEKAFAPVVEGFSRAVAATAAASSAASSPGQSSRP